MTVKSRYDIVILGAGLAGNSLCRHLLLRSRDKKILMIDNRAEVPGKKQKYGESLVQVGGYYFSKVLELEEYMFREQYLKYNLRFYWKTPGTENRNFEDYSQSFIRGFSNVCSYQLNRNKIEEHMLGLNRSAPNVTYCAPAIALKVGLSETGPHHIAFRHDGQEIETEAEWVVDTTGRGQFLKKREGLALASPIQNGGSWCWVEGLVDFEKLTDATPKQIRIKRDRMKQGMAPLWLATNHFCAEGLWFWVIPLQGITSLGVVYDNRLFDGEQVSTAEKLIEWACREFPIFQRDLPKRRILDSARLVSYAYDCKQTISPSKWAMSGMAGRFTDPLYSPGSDLISYYNSMIVDTILESDPAAQRSKCELYSQLMRVVYDAYVPTYAVSYNALGSQQVFTLKYSWELSIYFSFFVFPFINDFFTDSAFIYRFFRKFSRLGPVNRNLQEFLACYYRWWKSHSSRSTKVLNDFMELTPLKTAETAFYEVGVTVEEAGKVLDKHLVNLEEFARFILAYVTSVVLKDRNVLMNRSFVESIDLKSFPFDADEMNRRYAPHAGCTEPYRWALDAAAMEQLRNADFAATQEEGPGSSDSTDAAELHKAAGRP
jgi:flavin-dependent dehydrogenase